MTPLALSAANIARLAHASDPFATSLAVYYSDELGWFIWGLIDQAVHYRRYLTHEIDRGPSPPGAFSIDIDGVGSLSVYSGYSLIASLRYDRLVAGSPDVLRAGPVAKKLGLEAFATAVRRAVGPETYDRRGHWNLSIRELWVSVISRLLLIVQRRAHGATILLRRADRRGCLQTHYQLVYDRLPSAMMAMSRTQIELADASDLIHEKYLVKPYKDVPIDLYLDEAVARDSLEEIEQEIDGCIRFMASLTQVDGALVVNQDWAVEGFGVEIRAAAEPSSICVAQDGDAKERHLRGINPDQFGTRHRSAFRYAWHDSDGVAFVVSQDGDIRAITRVNNRVVMWENIALSRVRAGEAGRKRRSSLRR